jgi:cytochrome c oxidase subunit III
MSKNKTGNEQEINIDSRHLERVHPYKSFLFFSLVGSSILFLSLIFLYIIWMTQNPAVNHFRLPKAFIVSTLALLISSYTVTLAQQAFRNDDNKKLLLSFTLTLGFTLLFAAMQVIGWTELYERGLFIDGPAGVAFLYIISGLHFLHLGAGLLWQFYLSIRAFDVWNDPVKSLVYFSNKFEGTRIDLFATFWHYLDILWLCLFLTFLFTL